MQGLSQPAVQPTKGLLSRQMMPSKPSHSEISRLYLSQLVSELEIGFWIWVLDQFESSFWRIWALPKEDGRILQQHWPAAWR
mmetsp:Transcript_69612/g.112198  ORF Transcript_69612/g.112198 Transcript_69612/m.112198 type:complete len:82 (-) Transcript_69612:209-454(-)